MYELNEALQQWKTSLAQGGAMSSDDLDELEAHLRDEMEALRKKGLSDEEAFIVSSRRLGRPADLVTESFKTSPMGLWHYRFYWMAAGGLLYMMIKWSWTVTYTLSRIALHATGVGVMAQNAGQILVNAAFACILGLLVLRLSRTGLPQVFPVRWLRSTAKRATLGFAIASAAYVLSVFCVFINNNMNLYTTQEAKQILPAAVVNILFHYLLPLSFMYMVIFRHKWSQPEVIWVRDS